MAAIPSSSPPVACTLSAADYKTRTTDMSSLAREALTDRVEIPGGHRLTFAAGDGVEQSLRGFVAAESTCCAFLTFDLRWSDETELVLEITGSADAQPIIAELFA